MEKIDGWKTYAGIAILTFLSLNSVETTVEGVMTLTYRFIDLSANVTDWLTAIGTALAAGGAAHKLSKMGGK